MTYYAGILEFGQFFVPGREAGAFGLGSKLRWRAVRAAVV